MFSSLASCVFLANTMQPPSIQGGVWAPMEVKEPTENAAPKQNSTEDRQLQSPDYENDAGRDAVRLVKHCVAMPPFQSACFLIIYLKMI